MKIGAKFIGPGKPTFIIAEMSGNHNHDFSRAKKIIDMAAYAGVDAVKLQTYTPDTMTIKSDKKWFSVGKGNAWEGKTLYDLYKWAYTPWEWQQRLMIYAQKKGLVCFSTPFDESAVDFLEGLSVPVYKVASFEITDLELLARIGKTRKPVIVSRGLATLPEIRKAVAVLKKNGAPDVAVLHCVSSYPATPSQMNLATVPDLAKKLHAITGLSDHSLSPAASVAAVALGAHIIEKHLTLKRADGGPDAEFSLEPEEMKALVGLIRDTEQAIGVPTYVPGKKEQENLVFRRSIFAVADIKKGQKLDRSVIRVIRPGFGMSPHKLSWVLKRKAACDIPKGTPILPKNVA